MNIEVVRNAVGELTRIWNSANGALTQVEAEAFRQVYSYQLDGWYEYPQAALGALLQELHDTLLVVLEAAEMPETRNSLLNAWGKFDSEKDGLEHTNIDTQFMSCTSPALTFLERLIDGLRMSVTKEISSEEAWTLNRLEDMLKATATLLHRRKAQPEDEHALQEIMHDYLRACFPDFRLNPSIGGTLKTFKPDCGIASVSTAIEFKIVHTKKDVAVAISGIAEDSAGYNGSKDWTRFYAVLYQAQAFISESEVRHELKRIGAKNWKPIVVNGPAKKSTRSRAKKQSHGIHKSA